jgi:UMF1 family MFS transporter
MPTGALDRPHRSHGDDAEQAGKRALFGWVLFDWASQPFYTLVVTFLFAPYFVNGFIADPARGAALWAYATGIAELIAAALAPVLGAMADAGQPRKPWIAVFSAMLVFGLCGLWLAAPGRTDLVLIVLIAFGLATIGAELATVFTNAMMSSLVSGKRLGTLSGAGWAVGYVGGLVSLALVAGFLVADPGTGKTLLGLPPLVPLDPATREGDRLVGPFSALWYLVFILPLFLFTPDRREGPPRADAVSAGLAQLMRSVRDLVRNHAQVALFLLARMIYADGLGAVFAFGGIYAATVFGWGATELGLFGIILTIAGAVGAALGGLLDDVKGSKAVIVVGLLLFIVAAVGVLSVDPTHVLFVVPVEAKLAGSAPFTSLGEQVCLGFAMLIGFASGPVQSSSRTLLARLSPPGKATEFFGFFSFSGKITAFAAPLLIGAVTHATGSQRLGIGTSLIFLVAGLLLLLKVKAR